MGLTIIPSMPGETLGLLVGPGGSGAAMMFPFWKALHRLRGVSPLWHSEMVTSPVSPARFVWCCVQSTTLGVSLWAQCMSSSTASACPLPKLGQTPPFARFSSIFLGP
jgi:hypothetical protein